MKALFFFSPRTIYHSHSKNLKWGRPQDIPWSEISHYALDTMTFFSNTSFSQYLVRQEIISCLLNSSRTFSKEMRKLLIISFVNLIERVKTVVPLWENKWNKRLKKP